MRKDAGVIVEDSNRKLILCNSKFCEIFSIPVEPSKMIGSDCSKSAEFVKHLFIDGDKFVSDIEEILKKREVVVGQRINMENGDVLIRDYFPIFSGDDYLGHSWHYYLYDNKLSKIFLFFSRLKNLHRS